MSRDQIDALERWIVAIIKDEDRASDSSDYMLRLKRYKELLVTFELEKFDD